MKTFGYILIWCVAIVGAGRVVHGLVERRERWHLRYSEAGCVAVASEWHTRGPFEVAGTVYTFRTLDGFDLAVDASAGNMTVERESRR